MENKNITDIQTICQFLKKNGKYKLNKKGKIKFAYNYWNITDEDIMDLYYFLAQNKSNENAKLAQIIGDFINAQTIANHRKIDNSFYDRSSANLTEYIDKIKSNGNWLSLYDIEREFAPALLYQSPIMYSYITKDQKEIKIDKEKANEILGILIENNIPTAKIIVTGSFPYYANNNINSYIKSFK